MIISDFAIKRPMITVVTMVALVVFLFMATSLGTIPNRCLSVTNLSTSWS